MCPTLTMRVQLHGAARVSFCGCLLIQNWMLAWPHLLQSTSVLQSVKLPFLPNLFFWFLLAMVAVVAASLFFLQSSAIVFVFVPPSAFPPSHHWKSVGITLQGRCWQWPWRLPKVWWVRCWEASVHTGNFSNFWLQSQLWCCLVGGLVIGHWKTFPATAWTQNASQFISICLGCVICCSQGSSCFLVHPLDAILLVYCFNFTAPDNV